MDVELEHGHGHGAGAAAAAGTSAMPSVSSQLAALCDKVRTLSDPGTGSAARKVAETCICMAICNLGNAASPELARMTVPLTNAYRFQDTRVSWTGTHGYVRKVRHLATGKVFAVKALYYQPPPPRAEEAAAEAANARLVLREACFLAACLGHPSLVRFYGVTRHAAAARYCLAMEYVGPSLHDVVAAELRRGKPFPERAARRVVRQVLAGAAAMHGRGVVHRAIEPRNVLVAAGGAAVKIGDFGEAACVSETDAPYTARSAYMPPEELLAAAAGAAGSHETIDSWSIGCLMAELLTGKPLFEVAAGKDERAQQLHKIFRVLGAPGKRTMRAIKAQGSALAGEVEQWRAWQRCRAGKQRGGNRLLRELIPGDVLSADGFEVLKGLLKCNPDKRLTAAAALRLPWFTGKDLPLPAARAPQGHDTDTELEQWLITCRQLGLLNLIWMVVLGLLNLIWMAVLGICRYIRRWYRSLS